MKSLIDVAKDHGNPHKILLQLLLKRGDIRTSKMVEVFQSICNACSIVTEIPEEGCTSDDLCEALIETINPVLKPIDLSVGISTSYSVADESYLVMIGTSSSSSVPKNLFFSSDNEKQLFDAWIKIMFDTNAVNQRGELDATTALNSCTNENIRPLQAEAFLNKLERENILLKLSDMDSYIFSPKSVIELEPVLRASDYEVPSCPICSKLVIVRRFSHHCFICNIVIHNTCLHKMIKLSTAGVACPGLIDDSIRCTNKFDDETLASLIFDTPAPEVINRPVEIVGIRGGTQAPEDDEEYGEEMLDKEKEDCDDESDSDNVSGEEGVKPPDNFELRLSDDELADKEMVEDTVEEENVGGESEDETTDAPVKKKQMTEDEEEVAENDEDDEIIEGERENNSNDETVDHRVDEGEDIAGTSRGQGASKAKKKNVVPATQKTGDALDDLLNEMEDEEEAED